MRAICVLALLCGVAAQEPAYAPCLKEDAAEAKTVKEHSMLQTQQQWSLPDVKTIATAMKNLQLSQANAKDQGSAFRKAAFNTIYETNYWKDGEKGKNEADDASGGGSWSRKIEDKLCDVIAQRVTDFIAGDETKPVRILDAPSGDFHWMKPCLDLIVTAHPNNQFTYAGMDIADVVIDKLNKDKDTFSLVETHKNLKINDFKAVDLADGEALQNLIGKDEFDIIITVHALMHNSNDSVGKILKNINTVPGGKFFITNNYHYADRAIGNLPLNTDIATGMMRPLNLQQKPFNLGANIECSTPVPTREYQETFKVYKLPLPM